jgi:malate dehydrogenase (quinone)
MSATLWALLHELNPLLKIGIFERLWEIAKESSDAMNNAGTGHSAFCELNYTPQNADWTVDINKAIWIIESFEVSKQFWANLAEKGYFTSPKIFINSIPHCSLVFGSKDVKFLKTRYEWLQTCHLFHWMQYSEDPEVIKTWMPLIMENRDPTELIAATYMPIGTDIDFGALTRAMVNHLTKTEYVSLHLNHEVKNLLQDDKWMRTISVRDTKAHTTFDIQTPFVFIWAGGWALPLLQKSHIAERKWLGGFPVSWQRLICNNPAIIEKHGAKVYGKAALWAPPMSVPHLDTRIINWKKQLLFWPYAWFTTKFLRKGSFLDLPLSIHYYNIITMLGAWAHNIPLTKYLIDQVRQSTSDRLDALRDFVIDAKKEDWDLKEAWYRVQIMKADKKQWWKLQFGTEVIVSADKSLATLLGASPWASTSVDIMLEIVEKAFPEYGVEEIRKLIPSYGVKLRDDEKLAKEVRGESHSVLGLVI